MDPTFSREAQQVGWSTMYSVSSSEDVGGSQTLGLLASRLKFWELSSLYGEYVMGGSNYSLSQLVVASFSDV